MRDAPPLWLTVSLAVPLGFLMGVCIPNHDRDRAIERGNKYEHDLAMCQYVAASCYRGDDLSGLTDEARRVARLPAQVRLRETPNVQQSEPVCREQPQTWANWFPGQHYDPIEMYNAMNRQEERDRFAQVRP